MFGVHLVDQVDVTSAVQTVLEEKGEFVATSRYFSEPFSDLLKATAK